MRNHLVTTFVALALSLLVVPSAFAGDKKAKKDSKKASSVTVTCDFADGWVSVLPEDLYDEKEEFLMQSLIGLTEDPGFWGDMDEYKKLAGHAAQKCDKEGVEFHLTSGGYKVLVGWAGRFNELGDYKDNGHIRDIKVKGGKSQKIDVTAKDMTHTWLCISCPYIAVRRGGQLVELGQTLVDRYNEKRAGTDVHAVDVDVVDGVIEVVLIEREPETSYIDAVELVVQGRALPMLDGTDALRKRDGRSHSMRMGDELVLRFDASALAVSSTNALIRVSGYYTPVGSLR